jgi:hypothetical protein
MAKAISEFVLAGVEWGNEGDYFVNRLLEKVMKQAISKMESEQRELEAEH